MKSISRLAVAVIALIAVASVGCGSTSPAGSSSSETDGAEIYTKAAEVMPSITASGSASVASPSLAALKDESSPATWTSGVPLYEVFSVLREYDSSRDEGVIDVSNIRKLLTEASTQYEDAIRTVVELAAPTAIASPFNFGTAPRVYTHASDHHASALDGDAIAALLTWIWSGDPSGISDASQMAYGVFEGDYSPVTGDLILDMAYLVDYPSDSANDDFSLRTRIEGNVNTHQFTLKMAKHVAAAGGYAISIVAKGIAESTSADDYFLLKIIDNVSLAGSPEGRFFKVPASPTEEAIRSLPEGGQSRAELDDPRGYADALDALTFFALDGSDNPTTTAAFSPADLVLAH